MKTGAWEKGLRKRWTTEIKHNVLNCSSCSLAKKKKKNTKKNRFETQKQVVERGLFGSARWRKAVKMKASHYNQDSFHIKMGWRMWREINEIRRKLIKYYTSWQCRGDCAVSLQNICSSGQCLWMPRFHPDSVIAPMRCLYFGARGSFD